MMQSQSRYQQEIKVIIETIRKAVQFYSIAIDKLENTEDVAILKKVKSLHVESTKKLDGVLDSPKMREAGARYYYQDDSFQMLAEVRTTMIEARKQYANLFSVLRRDQGNTFIFQLEEVEDALLDSLDKILEKQGAEKDEKQIEKARDNIQETHDTMKDLKDQKNL